MEKREVFKEGNGGGGGGGNTKETVLPLGFLKFTTHIYSQLCNYNAILVIYSHLGGKCCKKNTPNPQ